MMKATESKRYESLEEFYPFYLSEHAHPVNRRLHFVGTFLVLCLLMATAVTGCLSLFWFLPVVGYGFAWVGHFMVEKNRPATFTHPLYSLICDFRMFFDILRGRVSISK